MWRVLLVDKGGLARRGLDPRVPLVLELEGEILVAGADDPAVDQNVHAIRYDVVQEPLVVRDEQYLSDTTSSVKVIWMPQQEGWMQWLES